MPRFSDIDFLASAANPNTAETSPMATATVGLGHYATRINIPASNLLLPIPPPSPLTPDSDPTSALEPFPDFYDTSGYEPWEEVEFAPHCSLHCNKPACLKMVQKYRTGTTCRCNDEPLVQALDLSSRPQLRLRVSVMNKLSAIKQDCNADTELEIYDAEIYHMLRFLKTHTISQALENNDLLASFEQRFRDDGRDILQATVEIFYEDAVLYFKHTVPEHERRVYTIRQIRNVLQTFIHFSLEEWVGRYCSERIFERVMSGPPVCIGDAVKGDLAEEVLNFWSKCLSNVIAILAWRQKLVEEKARRKEQRKKEAQMKNQRKLQPVFGALGGVIRRAVVLCSSFLKFFV